MNAEQLAKIKTRCDAATPGPWVDMTDGLFAGELRSASTWDLIAVMPQLDDRPEDFKFIAYAREDIPALLAEVERLRSQVDELEYSLEDARHNANLWRESTREVTP